MDGVSNDKWLSLKGVAALNNYAEVIPNATALLTRANDEMSQSFAALYRTLGPRADEMRAAIAAIEQTINDNKAAIDSLPEVLKDKASQIQAYIDGNLTASDGSGDADDSDDQKRLTLTLKR